MPTPDDQTRAQRRALQTRRAITSAGTTLFASRGFANVTIGEITEHADVALGSFYNYFGNRDALIEAILGEARQSQHDFKTAIEEHLGDTADARLVALVVSTHHRALHDPTWADLAHEAARAGPWAGEWVLDELAGIVEHVEAARRTSKREIEHVRHAAGVVRALLGSWVDPVCRDATDDLTVDQRVQLAIEAMLRALGYTPAAISRCVKAAAMIPAELLDYTSQ